jgi:hypothetical protein
MLLPTTFAYDQIFNDGVTVYSPRNLFPSSIDCTAAVDYTPPFQYILVSLCLQNTGEQTERQTFSFVF